MKKPDSDKLKAFYSEWLNSDQRTSIEDFIINHYETKIRDFRFDLLNQPEVDNFIEGVKIEAAHQTERWGLEKEESEPPHHYILVANKLLGKMAVDIWDKNVDKFKHHIIALAAAMHNLHRQIDKPSTVIFTYFHGEDMGEMEGDDVPLGGSLANVTEANQFQYHADLDNLIQVQSLGKRPADKAFKIMQHTPFGNIYAYNDGTYVYALVPSRSNGWCLEVVDGKLKNSLAKYKEYEDNGGRPPYYDKFKQLLMLIL